MSINLASLCTVRTCAAMSFRFSLYSWRGTVARGAHKEYERGHAGDMGSCRYQTENHPLVNSFASNGIHSLVTRALLAGLFFVALTS